MIKKILPFEKLIYHSSLPKEEVLEKLQQQIGISQSYVGFIYGDSFRIKRAINYRNSFLPEITGTVKSSISGSKIEVEMRLLQLVKVFMIVWLSGVVLGCLGTLYGYLFAGARINILFIPFAMLFFGIAMFSIGFKTESKKSIKDLESLLNAKIIENR